MICNNFLIIWHQQCIINQMIIFNYILTYFYSLIFILIKLSIYNKFQIPTELCMSQSWKDQVIIYTNPVVSHECWVVRKKLILIPVLNPRVAWSIIARPGGTIHNIIGNVYSRYFFNYAHNFYWIWFCFNFWLVLFQILLWKWIVVIFPTTLKKTTTHLSKVGWDLIYMW